MRLLGYSSLITFIVVCNEGTTTRHVKLSFLQALHSISISLGRFLEIVSNVRLNAHRPLSAPIQGKFLLFLPPTLPSFELVCVSLRAT